MPVGYCYPYPPCLVHQSKIYGIIAQAFLLANMRYCFFYCINYIQTAVGRNKDLPFYVGNIISPVT